MDDQFDKDLKNRIREVFDNYEDPTADEGWLQLRKKFPEEQSNRRAILWLWRSAAAVLFLLLSIGLGLWLNHKPLPTQNLANKPFKHQQPINSIAAKQQPDSKRTPAPLTAATNNTKANTSNINSNTNSNNTAISKEVNQHPSYQKTGGNQPVINSALIARAVDSVNHDKTAHQQLLATKNKPESPVNIQKPVDLEPILTNDAGKTAFIAQTPDTIKHNKPKINNQQLAVSGKQDTAVLKPMITKPKPNSIEAMLAADNGKPAEKEKYKKLSFEVYAASYFNFAQGSSNQLNVGGGFTANIALSKNLVLVTGVSVGQNSLSYANAVPVAATASAYAVARPSGVSTYNLSAFIPAASVSSIATLKDYSANLVSLDVPVNLKYQFNPQATTYFLAGVSSGTFINESYTSKYSYSGAASSQQALDQTSSKSFNNFYFAKTLNVAFGVGAPFGKNWLIIEPFLKYPLQGLGAQDIRFGAGGLNLKFNFQPTKK